LEEEKSQKEAEFKASLDELLEKIIKIEEQRKIKIAFF
jgi:hypothetical protein